MDKEKGELIGKVTHYYNKAGVAIIELSGELAVGNAVNIVGGNIDFTQTVESMEIERQKIETAKAGDVIGLKVDQPVKEGYQVYKI